MFLAYRHLYIFQAFTSEQSPKISPKYSYSLETIFNCFSCTQQTKSVSLQSIGNESTQLEHKRNSVTILLLLPIAVIRNLFVFRQLLVISDF